MRLLTCLFAVLGMVVAGCATTTAAGAGAAIAAMAPTVVSVIAAHKAGERAEEAVERDIEAKCKGDLRRASAASVWLIGEYRRLEAEIRPSTRPERLELWRASFETTRSWYLDTYGEMPYELVQRLYECAGADPPEATDDWAFYVSIALKHLGYEVTAAELDELRNLQSSDMPRSEAIVDNAVTSRPLIGH